MASTLFARRYNRVVKNDSIGVYIHVPYCRIACPYCDFVKRPIDGDAPDTFTDALCREMDAYDGPLNATSIFFGGGTPSLLPRQSLERIFEAIHSKFTVSENAEISLEANPDDVTPEIVDHWIALGVSRLNLGIQSFDDEVLRFLGRCHDAATAHRTSALVAERFDNWGMDLIFGAKPTSAWDATLETCLALNPPHVSTYALTYEQRTPFWNQRHAAIDDDQSLGLYRRAVEALEDYDHYEVSNFAMPGFQSAHNQIYWRNESYAGFGAGAVSYVGGIRARNVSRITEYLRRPGEKEESERLSPRDERVETLIQHLRTRAGIGSDYYERRFGTSIQNDFGDALRRLAKRGLLVNGGESYYPTRHGFELNNEIGLELV